MLANIQARAAITPLVQNDFTVLGSSVRFTTACFGGADKEWSLAPLQEPGDVSKNIGLAKKIRSAVRHLGADRIYAPNPVTFNGKIINPAELSKVMVLGHGVLLFRNKAEPADGTFLRVQRDAGIFSAGGCGFIVATCGDLMIFAHMGRESVIDRERVLTGSASRSRESVVDYIIHALLDIVCYPSELADMRVWVLYSIKPEDFLHRYDNSQHGTYNRCIGTDLAHRGLASGYRKTVEGVEIDIPVIAKLQFMAHNIPEEHINLEHAYLADELPTTRKGGGRYLVVIVRHF